MNVAAYCRVSTDKSDQLNSLETQKEFFESYCERNGLVLIHTYADEGISGTKTKNRIEFLRMMGDSKKGLFEQVIVKDVSRLARNTVDLLQSVRTLKSMNIDTVFITSDMTSMGNSEFVLTLMGAMAQEESSNTSKRVKFGKRENAKKGRVPNIVYGYDKIPGDFFNLKINQAEEKIIRQIFNWYTEDGYGAAKIATMLNEKNIMTKRNCLWSQNAIGRILKNPIYTGIIINGKEEITDFLTGERKENNKENWIVIERPQFTIIEEKQFRKAQNILQNRMKTFHINGERQSNKYLFSTMIKCEECGYSFRRIERVYKNKYTYWVCSGHNENGTECCNNKIKIPEEELEMAIREYFKEIVLQKEKIIKKVTDEMERQYKEKRKNNGYEKDLKRNICKLQKNKDKMTQMYLDDLISNEELKEKVKEINNLIKFNQKELQLVLSDINRNSQTEKIIKDTFHSIENIFAEVKMTNAQLKEIIKQILVRKDGTVHIYLKLFHDIGLDEVMVTTNLPTEKTVSNNIIYT